jgi:hypothetical protein
MSVYQNCSNKSPWVKIGLTPATYIQVSDFRAIMTLLFCLTLFAYFLFLAKTDNNKNPQNLSLLSIPQNFVPMKLSEIDNTIKFSELTLFIKGEELKKDILYISGPNLISYDIPWIKHVFRVRHLSVVIFVGRQ